MNHKSILYPITFTILSTVLSGCGGDSGSNVRATDLIGQWTGSVQLAQNGCPREIPVEAHELFFTHIVSEDITGADEVRVNLRDRGNVCIAERVGIDSNTFSAVCPSRPLPGFLPGFNCSEQVVWEYTVDDPSGTRPSNPVVRTAFVLCQNETGDALACPVEYSGEAGRCIRDLC